MTISLLMTRYDQGVFSGIIGNENFRNQFGNPNTGLEGIIVSIYNLGCFTGCIFAFFFCERTGRRLAMWIAMGFIIVSPAFKLGLVDISPTTERAGDLVKAEEFGDFGFSGKTLMQRLAPSCKHPRLPSLK
jgi:MFS family permease